jgi:hypothetical protein
MNDGMLTTQKRKRVEKKIILPWQAQFDINDII